MEIKLNLNDDNVRQEIKSLVESYLKSITRSEVDRLVGSYISDYLKLDHRMNLAVRSAADRAERTIHQEVNKIKDNLHEIVRVNISNEFNKDVINLTREASKEISNRMEAIFKDGE